MKKQFPIAAMLLLGMLLQSAFAADPQSPPARRTISLNGPWLFQRDGAKPDDWKTVQLPASFEQHEGPKFDGVGWYRKSIDPLSLPVGKRALLHFQAAATEAEVWLDGERLGTHLGGWTPFRFDVTDQIRKTPADRPHELKVRLDEKVGHNSQGFLPIIAPHFGGIWQDVQLLIVPETYCDDLRVLAVGNVEKSEIQFEIPLAGTGTGNAKSARPVPSKIRYRLRSETNWTTMPPTAMVSGDLIFATVLIKNPRLWSPDEPNLYEVEIALGGENGDQISTRAAFRTVETFGPELRLNGRPLKVRGILNWGYSPPLTAPNPGEAAWRQEIEFARARGFNAMKFCLWMPPKRYLELTDELGLLAWMEYPTWHPTLTKEFLGQLEHEFGEFFYYDRNHPSIILRSLTCETGPGAELPVLQALYLLAKKMIPGAIVEDDSSWISWNRVHDFYDDHPYGNNHTWVKTLQGFNEFILAHGIKPLLLGEAIAADTWIDREALLAHIGQDQPWWLPSSFEDLPHWLERLPVKAGPRETDRLRADSLRYALLMRKYQIEAYHREIPYGGYNVSVIRDFTTASMGLIDYLGKPKWSEDDWAWHRDTMCLLKTDSDRRSFTAGDHLRGEILITHFGRQPIAKGALEVTLEDLSKPGEILKRYQRADIAQNIGTLARITELDWPLPPSAEPKHLLLRATLKTADSQFSNSWPLWAVPAPRAEGTAKVLLHSSIAEETAKELFPGAPRLEKFSSDNKNPPEGVVVAAEIDDELLNLLNEGGRVLMLPNGRKHSFPLNEHWFLRGAPYVPDHALSAKIPRDLLVELQHFDLGSPVVPDINYLDDIDPILMLWDTHDIKTVKTHGLIFEARAGNGRLLISAVRHAGQNNSAGRWLLQELLDHLTSPYEPKRKLPDTVLNDLK